MVLVSNVSGVKSRDTDWLWIICDHCAKTVLFCMTFRRVDFKYVTITTKSCLNSIYDSILLFKMALEAYWL